MNSLRQPFWLCLALITTLYLGFWLAMLAATATYTSFGDMSQVLMSREIRYSTMLSLVTCTVSALLSVIVAVPVAYLMSRRRFSGHSLIDAALDIPIVLPPMVVGICLLIFFQTTAGHYIEKVVPFTYTIAGVILAQFVIAAAFAMSIRQQ